MILINIKFRHSLLYSLLAISGLTNAQELPEMRYTVDLTQNTDTLFVSLILDQSLSAENNIYQFAATAPGTYQTMNIGRYVSDFKVLDGKGNSISLEKVNVNQFKISDPNKAKVITYKVAETWDTPVDSFPVYPMCGSNLEPDHALLNAHTYIGYFHGLQNSPISLNIKKYPGWKEGTALKKKGDWFIADNFDHLVDSPILMGKLTYADTIVAGTEIRIYTYSEHDKITSRQLLTSMSNMLYATSRFLITLPVGHYTFLYNFEKNTPPNSGAWEHSYSSEFTLAEVDFTPDAITAVTDIAAHEFFHIVTPLNIHSEIIETFNFVSPQPSIHLWLYEGVTEWASHIIQYRAGIVNLPSYLTRGLSQKINAMYSYFDDTRSLKQISEKSFSGGEASKQYANIYYKGSVIASLLDIRLLELSDGTYGLRELILDLIKKYGKGSPVSEATFFDDIVRMTYPQIKVFFDNYVLGNEPLPLKEYLAKIGISYIKEDKSPAIIKPISSLSESQEKLFSAWSKNLERK